MKASFSLVIFIPLRSLLYHAKSWSYTSHFLEHQTNAREVACEASVSVLFRRKGRAKNGASKRGGGGEERKEGNSFLPLPHPPLLFFASRFISRAAKTENSFLGLSLLRNSTETIATQAKVRLDKSFPTTPNSNMGNVGSPSS